jgi:hypothetical protein
MIRPERTKRPEVFMGKSGTTLEKKEEANQKGGGANPPPCDSKGGVAYEHIDER